MTTLFIIFLVYFGLMALATLCQPEPKAKPMSAENHAWLTAARKHPNFGKDYRNDT
jgi:hypothetical protein